MDGHNSRILLADRDPQAVEPLADLLRDEGILVDLAEQMESLSQAVREGGIDLVIADPGLHPDGGVELLRHLLTIDPDLVVILTSAFTTLQDALEAVKEGAFDYLPKPLGEEESRLAVNRGLDRSRLTRENRSLKEGLDEKFGFEQLLVKDRSMREVIGLATAVADSKATVLITGESGTGKTLLARAIHQRSPRRDGPFIEVNCGALPETLLESELFGHVKGAFTGAIRDKAGKFEQADGGTLFLDEIATASPALQVKLLRVIQDRVLERIGEERSRTVDVRLVLATNLDLAREVKEGRFREDLYYRINVVAMEIPPLRKRPDDIIHLAHHFLRKYAAEYGRPVQKLSPGAAGSLLGWLWPGNVRELENAIERAVVLCRGRVCQVGDLPRWIRDADRAAQEVETEQAAPEPPSPPSGRDASPPEPDPTEKTTPLKESLQKAERRIILQALEAHDWNRTRTAKALSIDRTTLFHKMRRHDLKAPVR